MARRAKLAWVLASVALVAGVVLALFPPARSGGPRPAPAARAASADAEPGSARGAALRPVRPGSSEDGTREHAAPADPPPPPASASGPPFRLVGRVVDSRGRPVSACQLHVLAARPPEERFDASHLLAQAEFEDSDGRFEFDLEERRVRLVARAKGHPHPAEVEVELPRAEPVELVLLLPGVVAGRVVDAFERPVPGAEAVVREGLRGDPSAVEVDAEGRFEARLAGSTTATVHARAPGHGPSALVDVEVPPEGRVEVELVLVDEAVLRGLVLDAAGAPDPGATVSLGSLRPEPRLVEAQRQADARGRFEFAGLPAGAYLVAVHEEQGPGARPRAVRLRQVELGAGQVAEVVLGGALERALLLELRVSWRGAPVAGRSVAILPEGPAMLERAQDVVLDSEGHASVALANPGRYRLSVWVDAGQGQNRQLLEPFVVPDTERPEVTLALGTDLGSVSGRVLGAERPPELTVLATLQDSWEPARFGRGTGGGATPDAEGRFLIEELPPGRYLLEAPGAEPQAFELLPSQALSGFELELDPDEGTGLAARVVDGEGRPVRGARVFVRDARGPHGPHGHWVARWWPAETDGEGRCAVPCLAPGDYTVSARAGERASEESAPVEVAAGATAEVELRLAPGAMLSVSLVDAEGTPVAARRWTVLDERDRGHHEQVTLRDVELALRDGLRSDARTVGPLPPGTYRVEAEAEDGRRAARTATLAAGWTELELRLP